jgi:hypothetical protein
VEYQSVPFRSHEISDELDTLTNESVESDAVRNSRHHLKLEEARNNGPMS